MKTISTHLGVQYTKEGGKQRLKVKDAHNTVLKLQNGQCFYTQKAKKIKDEGTSHLAVGWFGAVHFVDPHDELFDTQGVGQEGVLSRLSVFADSSLKLTGARRHNQDSTVGLNIEPRATVKVPFNKSTRTN